MSENQEWLSLLAFRQGKKAINNNNKNKIVQKKLNFSGSAVFVQYHKEISEESSPSGECIKKK